MKTIQEIRENKKKLQDEITKLLNDFKKENDVSISTITLNSTEYKELSSGAFVRTIDSVDVELVIK